MRAAATCLKILAVLVGCFGVIAGFVALNSPHYSYIDGAFTTLPNDGSGGWVIVASVTGGLFLLVYGMALDGIADIRDSSERSARATEQSARCLETLVSRIQAPDPQPSSVEASVPQPPPESRRGTIIRRIQEDNPRE